MFRTQHTWTVVLLALHAPATPAQSVDTGVPILRPASQSVADGFARAATAEGTNLIASSFRSLAGGAKVGELDVFSVNSNGSAVPIQNILPPSVPGNRESFGSSPRGLAVSGNTLAVGGSTLENPLIGFRQGVVAILDRPAPGADWTHDSLVVAPPASSIDPMLADNEIETFGWSLDLEDDLLVVGAPAAEGLPHGSNVDAGVAFVYQRASQAWQLAAVIRHPDPTPGIKHGFGVSVAIGDGTIFIGSANTGAGIGQVLEYEVATLPRLDGLPVRQYAVAGALNFGADVDYRNGKLLVGAPGSSTVYAGDWTATLGVSTWQSVGSPSTGFGNLVSLTKRGMVVAGQDSAVEFLQTGPGATIQLLQGSPTNNGEYGVSIAESDLGVWVGATSQTQPGILWAFGRGCGTSVVCSAAATNSTGVSATFTVAGGCSLLEGFVEIAVSGLPAGQPGALAYSISDTPAMPFGGGFSCIGTLGSGSYTAPSARSLEQWWRGGVQLGLVSIGLPTQTEMYIQYFYRDPQAGTFNASVGAGVILRP